MVKTDNFLQRQEAFNEAKKMVDPIVEEYALEPYKTGALAFTTGSTITPVDQWLDAIIRVADWLLETP